MMIMPTNNESGLVHYFAGKYPGKIGWLLSPDGWREPPWYMPFALDNGAFKYFDYAKFMWMVGRVKLLRREPLFVVCPDVLGNHKETLNLWEKWYPKLKEFGWKVAFVCQDGQEPESVPKEADVCFIGGHTEWKIKNAHHFKGIKSWLHIGRVNEDKRISWAKRIGADSVDGTGFFRGSRKQWQDFVNYFEGNPQCKLIE